MENIIGVKEASRLIGIAEQPLRCMLKSNKCTFGVAYKREGSTRNIYRIDKNALDRCLKGEQNLFKN